MKQIYSKILIIIIVSGFINYSNANNYCNNFSETIYNNFSVHQCDSMINANSDNPNFAILDVRTANEYNPQHIEGAININFYDSDFNEQLELLEKNKTFLVHCASGGRSANAFNRMKDLGFREVYNMMGGMNIWKSNGYPTTSDFKPELGIYECSYIATDTIYVNETDTIDILITNKANDTLKINSINITGGNNYYWSFDDNLMLNGAQNHSLQLIFSPSEALTDILTLNIESNGGNEEIILSRTSANITYINKENIPEVIIYPVPANDRLYIKNINSHHGSDYQIRNIAGQKITEGKLHSNNINISHLNNGIYLLQLKMNGYSVSKRFIKQ